MKYKQIFFVKTVEQKQILYDNLLTLFNGLVIKDRNGTSDAMIETNEMLIRIYVITTAGHFMKGLRCHSYSMSFVNSDFENFIAKPSSSLIWRPSYKKLIEQKEKRLNEQNKSNS